MLGLAKYIGLKFKWPTYLVKWWNSDLVLGFREGWNESKLPKPYIDFHNSWYILIFWFIGSLCVFLIIGSKRFFPDIFDYEIMGCYAGYIIFPIAFIFLIYLVLYNLASFLRGIYLIVTGRWIKRDSPIR